jgi:ribonucleoside-diphosphate reductase alpha chain
MNKRQKPENDRVGIIHKASGCGFEFYVTVNFYVDGKPSEIFIKIAKQGSTLNGFTTAVSVLVSVMLQYGIPWEVIYKKMHGMRFDPWDDNYTSLIDAFAENINKIIIERKNK